MKKTEIKKLEDKDLQLRYYLGGLKNISTGSNYECNYWTCSINCSCSAVPNDEKLEAVKAFIKNHNITNERFLKLAYNYLIGATMKYHGMYSQLFLELAAVIKPYQFTQTNLGEKPDNDFREKELEEIVYGTNNNSIISNFIKKYNLTAEDFIILAKTSINYNLHNLQVSNPNDTFSSEVKDILSQYELYVPREYIEEYRKEYQNKKKATELVINARATQKQYLKLMKELLIKYPDLATEMLAEELNELGFNKKTDIKKLIKQNQ